MNLLLHIISNFIYSVLNILIDIRGNVKKGIKVLIALNILSYIHILYLYNNIGNMINDTVMFSGNMVGIIILGGLLHYFFLFLTSFIFVNTDEYRMFRKEGLLDWVIRLLAYIVVFQHHNFEMGSNTDLIVIFILAVFLCINLVLEYTMLLKVDKYIPALAKTPAMDKVTITKTEIHNILNSEKAVAIGVGSIFIVSGFAIGFAIGIPSAGNSIIRKILMTLVSVSAFFWFVNIIYTKCDLFFMDKKIAYKEFLKNISFITIAYLLCLLDAFRLLGSSEYISDIVILIAAFSILPIVKSNRQMVERLEAIKEILNED